MNGRTPPPLPEITLPVSGYTVQIRPLGPLMVNELSKAVRRQHPAPEPPLNTVTGLDGKETEEPNPSDPDYIAAVEAYEDRVNTEVGERMLTLIAVRSIASPVDRDAVAQARADMALVGVELASDDREVWMRYVLIAHNDDLVTLQGAVLRHSMPTEAAVSEKLESFPDSVQGA